MQDAIALLMTHVMGVWRRRWLALGVAWVVAVPGWIYVTQMPESYVASARVYVDTNSILRPLMRGLAITPNINERVGMMSRTLLSRPNLEKLARMTDMDVHAVTEAQKENLIRRLDNSIRLSGTRGNDSLYSISVTDSDREQARRMAQALITIFIETTMSDKSQDSSGAQVFLERQLAESEARLRTAEGRLARFKQEHMDVLPGESGDYYSRLQQARSQLEQTRLLLREQENRSTELRRQLDGEEPVFIMSSSGSSGGISTPLDDRIQSLQVQLDRLLTQYTEKHPDIRRLQGLLDELEGERAAYYEDMRESDTPAPGSNLASSPVYQGMRSMLAESQAQVAQLNVRAEEYQSRVDYLAGKVNQIPEIEAQLKQLNRDYDVIARQHQQMLERRESARLSGDVESNAGDFTFRVVDPPFVPRQPSYPNKPLFHAGVLVVALGAGGALALALSLLFPVVTDPRVLTHVAGVPFLGSVTYNKTAEEARRDHWSLAAFVVCSGALLLAFATVVVLPQVLSAV